MIPTEIFNRCETKYLLDEQTFLSFRAKLAERMETDIYNPDGTAYNVENLYYDTRDNYLIRSSLQKPAYKEKLRLRSYGTPDENTLVFVEIKKKCGNIVNKRRSAMYPEEAYAFFDSASVPELKPHMNGQVLKEAAYMVSRLKLEPKVYISYDRVAYVDPLQPDLRVSFDTNIRARRTELRLENGSYGKRLLPDGYRLMEIKAMKLMPRWMAPLLSEYSIYPSGFSKYGKEYVQFLKQRDAEKSAVFIGGLSAVKINSFSA